MINLSDRYIHHRNLLRRGQQEIALYIAVFNLSMLLSVFLRTIVHLRATWIAVLVFACIICILCFCYFIGRYCDRHQIISRELGWQTSRNPQINEIKSKLDEIIRSLN